MSTISSFKYIDNKHDVYRDKFPKSLRKYAKEIINFRKEKKKVINKENQQKSYKNAKICFICKEKFEDKLRTIVIIYGQYRGATHSKCNLKYSLPKEIYTVFPTGSNYCRVSVVSFSYWSKIPVNIITASGVIKILVFKGLTRNPEIGNTFFCVLSNV